MLRPLSKISLELSSCKNLFHFDLNLERHASLLIDFHFSLSYCEHLSKTAISRFLCQLKACRLLKRLSLNFSSVPLEDVTWDFSPFSALLELKVSLSRPTFLPKNNIVDSVFGMSQLQTLKLSLFESSYLFPLSLSGLARLRSSLSSLALHITKSSNSTPNILWEVLATISRLSLKKLQLSFSSFDFIFQFPSHSLRFQPCLLYTSPSPRDS
eukprot:TRINITY_DN22500_c0_g1_i1.p1 TRINITY_DN22500_c0_g1~~TRINITY_DN22500_c0_g1_i1.p1  ORF type:complete len:212 (+),score=9.63 TRINITY_DN22500_c0_g1_i1:273-908(+)